MPKKRSIPKQVQNMASIKFSNPNLTIAQAMHATGQYSEQECKHSGFHVEDWHHCKDVSLSARLPMFIAHPTANSTNETITSRLMPPSTSIQSQSFMTKKFPTNSSASINQPKSPPTLRKRNSNLPREAKKTQKQHCKRIITESITTKKNVKKKVMKEATLKTSNLHQMMFFILKF